MKQSRVEEREQKKKDSMSGHPLGREGLLDEAMIAVCSWGN
jgi:hypothetical protein